MYVLAPNGTVQTYPYSVGQLFADNRQVSFPKEPTAELLASYHVFPVTLTEQPPYDPVEQSLTEGQPELIEGVWVQTWVVSQASAEEIAAREADLAYNIREKRARLLAECDWVVIKAYERNQNIPAEWEVYRQALRDITAQEGFPRNVTWPTKP